MPASNDSMASSGPSSTRAVDTSVAAPTSGTSNMTPVIIGVSVGVGCCVLLILGYRIWKCTGRSAVPLPPKGPLAHHRQRQMLSVYPQSKVPMYTGGFALFTNNAPYGDHTPHTSYQTDDSSISPSFSSPITSQASLIPTSEENGEITRKHRPSFGSTASPVRHPLHDHRKRTLSNAGSVHSSRSRQSSTNGTVRGAPHARHSRVDIVLPEPLAPGLYNNNTSPRQSRMRVPHSSRASSRERPFEARGEDGGSPLFHESAASSNYHHALTGYPPPVPPLPTGFYTASSTTSSPSLSDAPSPKFSNDDHLPTH